MEAGREYKSNKVKTKKETLERTKPEKEFFMCVTSSDFFYCDLNPPKVRLNFDCRVLCFTSVVEGFK